MATQLEEVKSNHMTADMFTGKKIVDREGIEFGKVKRIHINPQTLEVSGVTAHHGFRNDFFVPRDFIDRFTDETLLLSTAPVRKGVEVVDIDGHKIGKIKRIHRVTDTNIIESIEISDRVMHSKIISKSEISGIGEKVILKITKAEFKKSE